MQNMKNKNKKIKNKYIQQFFFWKQYLMEGNNHLVHTLKVEEDKSKLQITMGNLHNTYETLKQRRGEKKGNCCWTTK
jgi:hypothetical protein